MGISQPLAYGLVIACDFKLGESMKSIALNLEFNFHEQEVASAFYETNASGNDEKFAELVFAAAFAIRTMSNLGYSEVTDALGSQLKVLPELISTVPEKLCDLKPILIPYPGHAGRKRFIANLKFDSARMQLNYSAKGFGILARGVAYYATASVTSFFRYLAVRRLDDELYLSALSAVAEGCGEFQVRRQISVGNHSQLVMLLIVTAMEEYQPDWL
jgi:hypothetical protein